MDNLKIMENSQDDSYYVTSGKSRTYTERSCPFEFDTPSNILQAGAEIYSEMERENYALRAQIKVLEHQNNSLKEKCSEFKISIAQAHSQNQILISKISQIKRNFNDMKNATNKILHENNKKLKQLIYKQVEEFLQVKVSKFILAFKKEKICPTAEEKLQTFLEQLLRINSFLLEHTLHLKESKNKVGLTSKSIGTSYKHILNYPHKKQSNLVESEVKRIELTKNWNELFQGLGNSYSTKTHTIGMEELCYKSTQKWSQEKSLINELIPQSKKKIFKSEKFANIFQ